MAKKNSKKKHKTTLASHGSLSTLSIVENSEEQGNGFGAAYAGLAFELEVPQPTPLRSDDLMKLFTANNEAVSDCELLELILSSANPSINANGLAIRLLERFGSINKIFFAEHHLLMSIAGVNDAVLKALAIMRLTAQRMAKSETTDRPIFDSYSKLMTYLKLKLGHAPVQEFHVLFMDSAHHLIADEIMHRGTINHAPIYPREVVKRGIELSAAAIILVKNSPKGDLSPSKSEIHSVADIVRAAATVNITVHDQVIVSEEGDYSFKAYGLM